VSFRSVIPVVAVALSAAACTTSTAGQAQPVPTVTKSAEPQTTGPQATVGNMHVPLPTGARYTERSAEGLLDGCVSEGATVCEARLLDLHELASDPDAPINLPSTQRPFGWYPGTDVPTCITPASPPGEAAEATGSELIESGFKPIGPKKAEYGHWRVTCKDETQNNEVRMWWLPTSKILVVQYGAFPGWNAKMDTMLAGATFG
jgi:hypothetical protein